VTTRRLFVYLLGIALFVLSVRETLDPDLWWHLRTGEAIWTRGRVPTHDLFSFTVPHHEWIVQQWLTDTLMWLVYQAAGFTGLSVLFALVVAAAFLLVYARCDGRPYLAAFAVLLGLFAAALPLGIRPQMFNMLFLALFIYLVEGVKDGALTPRALWWLPPASLLWANMHSGYLAGIALLGVYVVGEGAQQLRAQRLLAQPDGRTLAWPAIRLLAGITVVSWLAALVNPQGYRLWLFPLFTLSSDAIQANIVEWRSPDFHLVYFWFFPMMAGVGILSWLYSDRRPTITGLLLFFGTAAAGLVSARHIPLFAVTAVPIIARHLLRSLRGTRLYPLLSGQTAEPPLNRFTQIVNWSLLALVTLTAVLWTQTRLQHNDRTIAERFPVAAVDYIEQAGLAGGRVYNLYEWGGYLIWRRMPVFIDGRTELYGDDFFLYYLQTIQLQENWRRPLDEFEVAYVLVGRSHPLATLLVTSGEWETAYQDDVAQVLVRRE
jgi:hypothetical protein